MKKSLIILSLVTLSLGYVQYLTLEYVTYQGDRTQFLIAERELRAAGDVLEMFEDSKTISKEEHDKMKDRYINAMREFSKVADPMREKYPTRPEFKVFYKLTKPINGTPMVHNQVSPEFEETLKDLRESM